MVTSFVYFMLVYRLQRGVGLTQKVDYPVYGLMRAQTFDNFVSAKFLVVFDGEYFHIINILGWLKVVCLRIAGS